jgi:molybdopterin-guanine dinucleotide biosynthesis protein A
MVFQTAHSRWEVAILAGGLSTRFGKDKSRLRLGHLTLLQHVHEAASALGLPIRIVKRDLIPRCGPLGGIFTALDTTSAEGVLFLSCDMPFLTSQLLNRLLKTISDREIGVFAAGPNGVGFPFWLSADALSRVKSQIERRELAVQALQQELRAKTFRVPKTWERQLFNINTPADFVTAQQWNNRLRSR